MYSPLTAAVRLLLFVLWTLVAAIPYGLCMFGRCGYRSMAVIYWRVSAAIVGVTVVVSGRLADGRPLLCMANHTSYLDIVALGSVIPGAFVAKAEVGQWPGFGTLARFGRTVFVDRRRSRAADHRDDLVRRLEEGEPLIVFPEGTSNDGNRVLPFKSSLFSVAERDVGGREVVVQPVSITYTRMGGLPMGYGWRPFYAWYGDMELADHLWRVLSLGRVTVDVRFHAPLSRTSHPSRKVLAAHCQAVVAAGVASALAGRPAESSPAAAAGPGSGPEVPPASGPGGAIAAVLPGRL